MTTRDRLLAILKERQRFAASVSEPWSVIDYTNGVETSHMSREDARASAADLNARHRLKRLCEEIAKVALEGVTTTFGFSELGSGTLTRPKTPEEIAAAILAIGEDNEHS